MRSRPSPMLSLRKPMTGGRTMTAPMATSRSMSGTGRSRSITTGGTRSPSTPVIRFKGTAMGHCYHHALSSARKWGGTAEDFLALHQFFDEPSKLITADFRHRMFRHHALGVFALEREFGPTI